MATTENTYTGNNSTTDYSFTFPYLKTTDIKASLAGTDTTAFTLANATTVRFNTAPGSDVAIRIYRVTSADDLAATFYAGSAIKSSDLNENFTQNLYVTQEAAKDVVTANTTANTAKTTADTAASNASTALSTANTASTNATNAVSTANSASSSATSAVSTANTASTNATNAVNTANTASTNATNAVNTANTASTNASNALSTANTASTNATNAVSTANSASSTATTANTNATNAKLATDRLVATTSDGGNSWTLAGNNTNASTDPKGVGYAISTAETAKTTADAASASVAAAVLYTPKSNKAALEATEPSADGYYEVADSTSIVNGNWTTNSVQYTLSGMPSDFQGSAGLTIRLAYTHSSKTYAWSSYFANDPEDRYHAYLRPGGTTVTYTVKVAAKNAFHRYNGSGSNNGFTINGEQAPFLEFTPGRTYKFDQADSSNAGHVLAFYEEADKTTAYTTGITTNGTAGQAGAYTQIVTTDTLPTILHYQSTSYAYEGNLVQCNTAFDRSANAIIDAGNFDNGTSTAALSNTYDGGAFD